jgi:LDH2 family malate/lactate/ureidoglycolate dehydrogenase
MALMVEILAGVLGGGAMVMDMDSHFDTSHSFLVIDPNALLPLEEFRSRLDRLVRTLQDSPRAEGSAVLVPGQLELDHEADTKANGLEMYPELWTELVTIGETYGVTKELEASRV